MIVRQSVHCVSTTLSTQGVKAGTDEALSHVLLLPCCCQLMVNLASGPVCTWIVYRLLWSPFYFMSSGEETYYGEHQDNFSFWRRNIETHHGEHQDSFSLWRRNIETHYGEHQDNFSSLKKKHRNTLWRAYQDNLSLVCWRIQLAMFTMGRVSVLCAASRNYCQIWTKRIAFTYIFSRYCTRRPVLKKF